MSEPSYHRQCVLKKGTKVQVSFLPEKYAKEGKFVKLRDGNEWEDGWKVNMVSSLRVPTSEVVERSQDYKHQREASDI